jgi:RNA polymerase sigma factor (sigma-70 family)
MEFPIAGERMTETPVSLLERLCREPDEKLWERFIRLFTPILACWARRLDVAPGDLDDVLQETFSMLVQQLPKFHLDPNGSFRAWLWTVFRRQVLAWRKRRGRELPIPAADLEALAAPDALFEATEAEYRRDLLDRALRLVQADFPTQTWQIFLQAAVQGRPAAEIAQEFGVTPNAVYLARARVLARLREELTGLDT